MLTVLKHRMDFKKVTKYGVKVVKRPFILFILKNSDLQDADKIKIGLIVTSKVGCAVERNRIKRRLRSLLALNLTSLPYKGYSLCVLAKRQTYFVDFLQMRDDLIAALNYVFQDNK